MKMPKWLFHLVLLINAAVVGFGCYFLGGILREAVGFDATASVVHHSAAFLMDTICAVLGCFNALVVALGWKYIYDGQPKIGGENISVSYTP